VTPDELIPVAWLAGRELELDEDEVRGPIRRAMLLLVAGGDPMRELDLDGRAVTALADELDSPERRARLQERLRDLGANVPSDLAWRAFAASLLAEELGGAD
jgi:hypothetical protein